MNRKITIAIAGLGSRGKDAYAPAIARMSDRAEIVAVADIDFAKVQKAAQIYHVPEERCFNSAESLLAENRLADVLVLATQDRQHVQQAIPALEKGYDLLLEKPISPNMAGMFQKRSWETCIIRTCRTPQSAGRSLPCSFASSVLLYRNLLPQNRWLLRPIMYGSIFMRRNGKPSCPLLIF